MSTTVDEQVSYWLTTFKNRAELLIKTMFKFPVLNYTQGPFLGDFTSHTFNEYSVTNYSFSDTEGSVLRMFEIEYDSLVKELCKLRLHTDKIYVRNLFDVKIPVKCRDNPFNTSYYFNHRFTSLPKKEEL